MTKAPAGYRLFYAISMIFVAMLMISNTISVKIIEVPFFFELPYLSAFTLPAGILCFPLAYIINDCVVEVYGYERVRSMIWYGFVCLLIMSIIYFVTTKIPSPDFENQFDFDKIFGFVPRIVVASFLAYLAGSFINAYIMSIMKVKTKGRFLWARTISSTIFSEGVDSIVFNFVAFFNVFDFNSILSIAVSGFILKTMFEIFFTPVTYLVVRKLKRYESADKFDIGISYTPFKI